MLKVNGKINGDVYQLKIIGRRHHLFILLICLFFFAANALAASPPKSAIIKISDARLLDTKGELVRDISKHVNNKDGDWVKNIHQGECIRATFEHILDNTRDITIYARPSSHSSNATIEVYPVYHDRNGNTSEGPLLGSFDPINHESLYTVLLKKLQKPTDQFDLKINGLANPSQGVDIDWIVDPDVFTLLKSFGLINVGWGPEGDFVLSGSVLYGMTDNGGNGGAGTIFSVNTDGTNLTVLHSFTGNTTDGGLPGGSLALSGSVLYGMTSDGGSAGYGIVFSINTDGTGFSILHSFTGASAGSTDGGDPRGSLTISGSVLYGMTYNGGSAGSGTVFSINTNGTGFTIIKSFGSLNGGQYPSSLVCSGSICYAAAEGGSFNDGIVFSIHTDGTSFTILHNFSGSTSDGGFSNTSLVLSGSVLYGMTLYGGSAGTGTIYSIHTDGSSFNLMHSFTGGGSDGLFPFAPLTISGSVIYGMTQQGGSSNEGTIFSINTDGTGFSLMHSFTGGGSDGNTPYGALTLSGSGTVLYGTTQLGGNTGGYGTIFSINTDGSGFGLLHSFSGHANDGYYPFGTLALSGSGTVLYGTTIYGGSTGYGSIFSINTDGSGFGLLYSFGSVCSSGDAPCNPDGSLTLSGTVLYGVSPFGGDPTGNPYGNGIIFSINTDGSNFSTVHEFTQSDGGFFPTIAFYLSGSVLYYTIPAGGSLSYGTMFSINTDGSGLDLLYTFLGGSTDGASPYGSLVLSGSVLYGMTYQGGSSFEGIIFSVHTDGTGFSIIHSFTGGSSDGESPYGSLVLSGSVLYGMTQHGGSANDGLIFSINTDGTGFNPMYSFSGGPSDGSDPSGSLLLSGSVLYGMTAGGGSAGQGAIFSINTNGTGYSIVFSFPGPTGQGPYGSLIISGSVLYGMTPNTSSFADGSVFSINTNGTGFTALALLINGPQDPSYPSGSLLLSGSVLYGTTPDGGSSGYGAIFSIHTDGSGFTVLHYFSDTDGAYPNGSLVLSGSVLYGMTSYGGSDSSGVIYSINTDGTGFNPMYTFTGGSDGAYPGSSLVLSGSVLYGMTSSDGSPGYGTIFSINTNGTGFSAIYSFSGGNDGAYPGGSLIVSGSVLYGMTPYGGSTSAGTLYPYGGYGNIFSVNTNGTGFSTLYAFSGDADGGYPNGALLLYGSSLYGMTSYGGSASIGGGSWPYGGYGTIFSINKNGSGFSTLYTFTGGNDGGIPEGSLTLSSSLLYGMTNEGGTSSEGTIFSMKTNGTGFSTLHAFAGSPGDGAAPGGSFTNSNFVLYGMSPNGGSTGYGAAFSFTIPYTASNTFFSGTEI